MLEAWASIDEFRSPSRAYPERARKREVMPKKIADRQRHADVMLQRSLTRPAESVSFRLRRLNARRTILDVNSTRRHTSSARLTRKVTE